MKKDHPTTNIIGEEAARWECNKCRKIVVRKLGWKVWTPSFCEQTGENARLYRISAPE